MYREIQEDVCVVASIYIYSTGSSTHSFSCRMYLMNNNDRLGARNVSQDRVGLTTERNHCRGRLHTHQLRRTCRLVRRVVYLHWIGGCLSSPAP